MYLFHVFFFAFFAAVSIYIYSFICRPKKIVWHGSKINGERAIDTYCDAWHSLSSDKIGLGSSLLGNKLLDQENYACNNKFVVLCIEAVSHETKRRRRDVHEGPVDRAQHYHHNDEVDNDDDIER